MNILGVAYFSDASAAVVRDGELVCAVSQERLNRIKQWNGVPHEAIAMALDLAGLSLADIDFVATHGAAPLEPSLVPFEEAERRILAAPLVPEIRQSQLDGLHSRLEHERYVLGKRTPEYLRQVQALGRPLRVYGHHEAHFACAYYGSGWDDCLVLTTDGWGEDGSATIWECRNGQASLLARTPSIDSLGYFYGSITMALGFIPHRHEGKVLGLAAYCREPQSYEVIRGMVDYDRRARTFIGRIENGVYLPRFENANLAALVARHDRTDIAAAAQKRLEEVVCDCLESELCSNEQREGGRRVALAGGIFANVKLNQCIAALQGVCEVYVFPNMGDGGLSVGAACLAYARETGSRPQPMRTALLGNAFKDEEIAPVLAASGVCYRHHKDIEERIAGLLASGSVVAHFDGRMEFGPRALGNRSILCQATDPSVNDWLNRRLARSEFMPFAPATLAEHAESCYRNLSKGREAAKYMTITFDSTTAMRELSPAAIHVDGTARPQIVSVDDYPRFHRILRAYHAQTNIPSVVNTSFNMHEEPIVCTVEDALRAFHASQLPYLAVGNFLVQGEKSFLN